MRNIVVLTTLYLNIPSANGLCARNLVDAFRKIGHDVYIVCYEKETLHDEQRTDHILTVQQPVNYDTHSTIQKIVRTSKVVLGSTKPLINEHLVELYYQKLCEIKQRTRIDAIVAMYFPFESVEAMNRFSKMNRGVKTFIYELDSQGDGVSKSQIYEIYNRRYESWLQRMYRDVTAIVIMKSHELYWRNKFGDNYSDKLLIVDLPVLLEKKQAVKQTNDKTRMLYSGVIDRRYRSPSYLLSVLRELSNKGFDFHFSFYSKGDCEEELSNICSEINCIQQYGYVSPDDLNIAIDEADILINIGNSFSHSVPSKLISYLGFGKPIIHFSWQDNDVCNEYLDKYPLALIINCNMKVEEAVNTIIGFINDTHNSFLSYDCIEKIFYENTPEYSAKKIDILL